MKPRHISIITYLLLCEPANAFMACPPGAELLNKNSQIVDLKIGRQSDDLYVCKNIFENALNTKEIGYGLNLAKYEGDIYKIFRCGDLTARYNSPFGNHYAIDLLTSEKGRWVNYMVDRSPISNYSTDLRTKRDWCSPDKKICIEETTYKSTMSAKSYPTLHYAYRRVDFRSCKRLPSLDGTETD